MMQTNVELEQAWEFVEHTGTSVFLTGKAGTGKTTLAGIIAKVSNSYFVNLNATNAGIGELRTIIEDARKRVRSLQQRTILFLDEIQHVPSFERVVDNFFVQDNVDIYITGSNAYFMSSDIATLLTGRYVQVEMLPLSFKEFHSAYSQQNLSDMEIYNLYIEHSSFPRLVRVEDDESIDEY